jgi:hypothetical protein
MSEKLSFLLHPLASKATAVEPDVSEFVKAKTSAALVRAWAERRLTSLPFWFAVGTLGAALMAWDSRHSMNSDGLSYLDMASQTLQSGPHNLVNLNWSPLYPFLITVLLFLFHPSPSLEIPLLHLLNWLIFLAAQLCFAFFLQAWYTPKQDSTANERDVARRGILVAFAFWLFFWAVVQFIPISLVTPDLCVAGIVFLVGGICGQLCRPTSGWKHYFALGGALSLGYYAKAAMFPAALLLLLLLFFWPPSGSHNRYRVLVAVVAFFVASAPLVTFMSKRVGRLSLSESGNMNYAWWVNKVPPYAGWIRLDMDLLNSLYTGKPRKSAMLTHPPRILMEKPLTLEFSLPVAGTYPLWYDPVYWNEGAKARFNLRQQLVALKENLLKYGHAFMEMSSLYAGAMVLCLFGFRKGMLVKLDRKWYWLLIWPVAVGAMYACVHVEYRFLGGFFVLFWLAAYGAVLGRADRAAEIAALATVLCSLIISTIGGGALRHFAEHNAPDYLVVAEGLRRLGVNPGDQLAIIGTIDAYYARPAGVRIIAQISDVDEFWSLSAKDFEKVKGRLASIGVKALIAKDGPRGFGYGDWQEIPGTRLNRVRVLLLEPSSKTAEIPESKPDDASSVLDTAAPRSR